MGVQRDLIPVGREVAGVVLQGQSYRETFSLVLHDGSKVIHRITSPDVFSAFFSAVGSKVSFFQPDDEVVGREH